MTQFGSNVLLLTRLVVTLGSILEKMFDPEFRVQGKSKMAVHEKSGKQTKVYF